MGGGGGVEDCEGGESLLEDLSEDGFGGGRGREGEVGDVAVGEVGGDEVCGGGRGEDGEIRVEERVGRDGRDEGAKGGSVG